MMETKSKNLKGSASVLPDGSFVFRPYAQGGEPLQKPVYVTPHGGVYRTKSKIVVRLSFEATQRGIRNLILQEIAEVIACSQW